MNERPDIEEMLRELKATAEKADKASVSMEADDELGVLWPGGKMASVFRKGWDGRLLKHRDYTGDELQIFLDRNPAVWCFGVMLLPGGEP